MLSSQDDELLHILEDLQNESPVNNNPVSSDESRIRYHYSIWVTGCYLKMKSSFWKNDLDFVSIQRKVNEPELRHQFEEFRRQMRMKWYIQNEPSDNFIEIPAFRPKSSWKPTTGHLIWKCLLVVLNKNFLKL